MKFREYLREAAGKNIKVGSKITWKNDDGDTLSGTIEKVTKDMSGTKIFKIKAKLNNKGKEILTTWPVGEIMRKATVVKEYVESNLNVNVMTWMKASFVKSVLNLKKKKLKKKKKKTKINRRTNKRV